MRNRQRIVAFILLILSAAAPVFAQQARIVPVDTSEFRALLRAARGGSVLVNFWATWCVPCVEEFPDIQRLRDNYRARGLTVILVSLDRPADTATSVARFLRNHGEHSTVYIKKAGNDEAFINAVSSDWSGALPATAVYDASGALKVLRIDKQTYSDLTTLIAPYLPR